MLKCREGKIFPALLHTHDKYIRVTIDQICATGNAVNVGIAQLSYQPLKCLNPFVAYTIKTPLEERKQ